MSANWEGPNAAAPASLNHYSKGAVCDWLLRVMCGIKVDVGIISPSPCVPGGHFTRTEAEYLSAYGRVKSTWEKAENSTTFTITIPANCTATLTLPGQKPQELAAGKYTLTSPQE